MSVETNWRIIAITPDGLGSYITVVNIDTDTAQLFGVTRTTPNGRKFLDKAAIGMNIKSTLELEP